MVAVGGTSISSQRDISFPAESSFPVMVNEFPVICTLCLEHQNPFVGSIFIIKQTSCIFGFTQQNS
jgi:hypothetical protein